MVPRLWALCTGRVPRVWHLIAWCTGNAADSCCQGHCPMLAGRCNKIRSSKRAFQSSCPLSQLSVVADGGCRVPQLWLQKLWTSCYEMKVLDRGSLPTAKGVVHAERSAGVLQLEPKASVMPTPRLPMLPRWLSWHCCQSDCQQPCFVFLCSPAALYVSRFLPVRP